MIVAQEFSKDSQSALSEGLCLGQVALLSQHYAEIVELNRR